MIKKLLDWLYYFFELFANHNMLFAKMYIYYHKSSVNKEIKLAGLKSNDRIIHIGCGAIPYTSIIIVKELNTKILGIDHHKKVINHAQKFVKRIGLKDYISLKNKSGNLINLSHFNVVFISYGIGKIDIVLRHVFENIEKNGKIILRRSTCDHNEYVDSVIDKYSVKKIRLLLTQESILIIKK